MQYIETIRNRKAQTKNELNHLINNQLSDKYNELFLINKLLSRNECKWIIAEAEEFASNNPGSWSMPSVQKDVVDTTSQQQHPVRHFLENVIYSRLMHNYGRFYGVDHMHLGVSNIHLVKYDASQSTSTVQPTNEHFGFTIALNDDNDYEGGSIHFTNKNAKISIPSGSAIIYCCRSEYIDHPVTSGVRYVIVGRLNL